MTDAMRTFRDRYARVLEWVVIALMIVLAVEVTLGVVFRGIGHSLVWYDEVASVLLAWLTFYGSALASVKRAHIGCPELVDAMPLACAARVRHRRRSCSSIAFFVLLGWVGASILPILATDCAREPAVGADERRAVGDSDFGGADRRRRGAAPARPARARGAAGAGAALAAALRRRKPLARCATEAVGDDHAAAVRGGAGARADRTCRSRSRWASSPWSRWSRRHGVDIAAQPRRSSLQRRDQLPAARDPAVHPRRRDHERVGHLAAADRVRHVAVRLDPRRPGAGVDRRLAVLRRDLRLRGRRRRRARLDPDPGDEGQGLPGAARRRGDVVGGDARGDHPAVDPDDPLRGDGGDVGRAAVRRRHRARASSAASA